jgi:hypothetical protein
LARPHGWIDDARGPAAVAGVPAPYVRLGFDLVMPRFISRIFTNGVTAAACAIFEISLLT